MNTPKTSPSDFEWWPILTRDNGGYSNQVATKQLFAASGVPDRHRDKHVLRKQGDPNPNVPSHPWFEAYRSVEQVCDAGGLVVLLGPRGTGKTQLAVCAVAHVCRDGHPSRYLKAMDLFREIRACFRKDGPNEVDVVNALCKLGLLVIDEAHERSDSDWENRTLTNIIDRRYDAVKPTILVSNMARDAFGQAVGTSIVSRIHECGRVIECNWKSFRVATK